MGDNRVIPTGGTETEEDTSDSSSVSSGDLGGLDDMMGAYLQAITQGYLPQSKAPTVPQPITGEEWGDKGWGIDQDPGDYTLYPTAGEDEASRTMYESGRPAGAPTSRVSRYSTRSPLDILNGMSSAELAGLEMEMIQANYFDEETVVSGQRAPLIGQFTSLLQQADANRIDWQDQLTRNVDEYQAWKTDNPEEVPLTWAQRNPFIAPVEVKPDYATLAQGSKRTMRQMLGRTPTSTEMKLLTAQLGSDYHDEWQTEVYDTAKMDWSARSRAHEAEATSGATGSVQGIDPEARFAERFEERYENELEHRERVDTSTRKSANLFGSIDTISRMTS